MTEIEKLRRRLFELFDAHDDEIWFRLQIRRWIEQGKPTTVFKLSWKLVTDINNMRVKKMYVNIKKDKMYVERDFIKWVRLAIVEIEEELKQVA